MNASDADLWRFARSLSSDELQRWLAAAEQQDPEPLARPKRSFADYIRAVFPRYDMARKHARLLVDTLQDVADGRIHRLMVFMPPRHGKSKTISELFPGYFLECGPDRWVGLGSYAANLSKRLAGRARSYYLRAGNVLGAAQATEHWETAEGGGMWSAGVGGSITGKGFHLGIIDDPVKGQEEAESEAIQDRNRDWWDADFYTRQEPGAERPIIVVQTRWNEHDLSGYILAQEHETPEGWHILDLPAIKEPREDEPYYPASCKVFGENWLVARDWRRDGEALCERVRSIGVLRKLRQRSPYWFGALFQQRPRPREGNIFKRAWFEIVDKAPPAVRAVRFWDHGGSEGEGDYTVGVRMMRDRKGMFYIEDVQRGQWSPGSADQVVKQTAVLDGHAVRQQGEQEPGSAGKKAGRAFVTNLVGFSAGTEPASGDKTVRARPLASALEVGMVKLVKGPWNKAFIDELCAFDKGANDDQVDGASGAFNWLTDRAYLSVDPEQLSVPQHSHWAVA